MIPDKMFNASRHEGSLDAKSARLYENSAWCAPSDSTVDYIEVHQINALRSLKTDLCKESVLRNVLFS